MATAKTMNKTAVKRVEKRTEAIFFCIIGNFGAKIGNRAHLSYGNLLTISSFAFLLFGHYEYLNA